MVGHWIALPVPSMEDRQLVTALHKLRKKDGWLVVHVLYARCDCSQRVFDHLLTSARPSDVEEVVLLVGDHEAFERSAPAAGFRVVKVQSKDLLQVYGIESAPLLAIVDPASRVRYLGGYTERKQGYRIHDVDLLEDLRATGNVLSLPAFGCGVSAELQRLLDPFRIKYRPQD